MIFTSIQQAVLVELLSTDLILVFQFHHRSNSPFSKSMYFIRGSLFVRSVSWVVVTNV